MRRTHTRCLVALLAGLIRSSAGLACEPLDFAQATADNWQAYRSVDADASLSRFDEIWGRLADTCAPRAEDLARFLQVAGTVAEFGGEADVAEAWFLRAAQLGSGVPFGEDLGPDPAKHYAEVLAAFQADLASGPHGSVRATEALVVDGAPLRRGKDRLVSVGLHLWASDALPEQRAWVQVEDRQEVALPASEGRKRRLPVALLTGTGVASLAGGTLLFVTGIEPWRSECAGEGHLSTFAGMGDCDDAQQTHFQARWAGSMALIAVGGGLSLGGLTVAVVPSLDVGGGFPAFTARLVW